MAKIIHIHYMAPTFYKSQLNGQRYLLPGWIPVSEDATMADVEWINPYTVKKDTVRKSSKEWYFESSSTPGQFYTVRIVNEQLTCSCPGSWRSKDKQCKHIKSVKAELSKVK